jgi:hypothetical protein
MQLKKHFINIRAGAGAYMFDAYFNAFLNDINAESATITSVFP